MTAFSPITPNFGANPGGRNFASAFALGQHILNHVAAAARRAADRSRIAGLPLRHLDDVGMTFADLEAALPGMDVHDPRNTPSTLAHAV